MCKTIITLTDDRGNIHESIVTFSSLTYKSIFHQRHHDIPQNLGLLKVWWSSANSEKDTGSNK